MINLIRRAYTHFLFWKFERDYRAATRRMQECDHENTMFVDVGTPPYDCVEKCRDCWALLLPDLADHSVRGWVANTAKPSRAQPATRKT